MPTKHEKNATAFFLNQESACVADLFSQVHQGSILNVEKIVMFQNLAKQYGI